MTVAAIGAGVIDDMTGEYKNRTRHVRPSAPCELARIALLACELAADAAEARELVDMIVGTDPVRRRAVRDELATLTRGRYAEQLADRIAGKEAARGC